MFWGTALTMLLGLGIGYYLSFNRRISKLLRAIIIIPWILPPVVSAASWQWMMNGTFGVINDLLIRLKIVEEGIPFLGNTKTALYALILVHTTSGIPLCTWLIVGFFNSVPSEIEEAAILDPFI